MATRPIVSVKDYEDIPIEYRDTPIGLLLAYHNLGSPLDTFSDAQMLIGTCMDHRVRLRIPENFAFIIRTGGANLRQNEFQISFVTAVGGVRTIALIGHTQCGMVNLNAQRSHFIKGLAEHASWEEQTAEEYFLQFAPLYEIGSETTFVASEANRLRTRFPNTLIVPLLFRVEDRLLYLVEEN